MGYGAKPQPINDLAYIGVKSVALMAAGFVDFPKNKCNFLHKNKLYIVRLVQFLTGRRPMRSFLLGQSLPLPRGSRRLCTAELGRMQLPVDIYRSRPSCSKLGARTSLLLPVDGTDRRGRTDTRPLYRRLPHMRAAAILQCAVISEVVANYESYVRYTSLHADIVNYDRVVII